MERGETRESHPRGYIFPLIILLTNGFQNQRYNFLCWGKCHEINRGVDSHIHLAIVPVFTIAVMYPSGTTEKIIFISL